MYLVSEDEYMAMGKHPEQQARLNAIALKDEIKMTNNVGTQIDNGDYVASSSSNKIGDIEEAEKSLSERRQEFYDNKHLHTAEKISEPKVTLTENILQFNALAPNLRVKATLLTALVKKHAYYNVDDPNANSLYDNVVWAVKPTHAKTTRPPDGWYRFLQFVFK